MNTGNGLGVLALVATIAATAGMAIAVPCQLDYQATTTHYFNGTLTDFVNYTNFTGNSAVYSFSNLTMNVSNVTENYTLNSEDWFLNLTFLCGDRTFFIINQSQSYYEVTPNQSVNISFIVSPVVFGSYRVSSWGIFNVTSNITQINAPMFFNYSLPFPYVTSGLYTQTFQIINGHQVQYLSFAINNTIRPEPRILKFDHPDAMKYGKNYNVSVFGDNFVNASVVVGDKTFNLTNTSVYYFEGSIYAMSPVDHITLELDNDVKSVTTDYSMATSPNAPVARNLILPAVKINESSRFLLVDFGVDYPVPLTVNSVAVTQYNQTADFAYYIANEDGQINPAQARVLYIYLTPQTASLNRITGNFTSALVSSSAFSVEFVGSQFTNQPQVNLTYYEKYTQCSLIVKDFLDPTNNSYDCHFSLPANIQLDSLQFNELQSMKDRYESTIASQNKQIADDGLWIFIGRVLIILTIIGVVVLKFHREILLWWQARSKG